ncbi:MAG: lipoprotein [Enterobacteriaceae bacterium]
MLKRVMQAGFLICVVLLTACDNLTQITLSEEKINLYLQEHVHYQKQIGVPGLVDANITLVDLKTQIGRSEPNKVALTGSATVNIASIVGSQKARVTLTLNTQPVYYHDQGAVYLKDLEITSYTIEPEKISSAIRVLIPYLNQSLRAYFEENPAYRFDTENSTWQSMAKKMAKGLEVKPGKLVIPF